jgi:DNA-binding transcriptional ArsR family regulator
MGTTKRVYVNKDINEIAAICKALGHPARIQIMVFLFTKNNRTCGDIVSVLPLAQSTVSKHLLELKKANLLNVVNIGKKTLYSIEIDKLHFLNNYLANYIKAVDSIAIPNTSEKKSELISNSVSKNTKNNLKKHNYKFPSKGKKNESPN